MISSGIKRGLATSAVSALALTGVSLLSTAAVADSIDTGAITLQSVVDGGKATSKNDGTNTTVSLVATANATARQVKFTFGPANTEIATVSRGADGTFSTEWAPAVAVLGTTVDIKATVVDADPGAPVLGTSDTATGVLVTADADSANLTPGAPVGLYNGKGAISGTSSVADGVGVTLGATLPGAGSGSAIVKDKAFTGIIDLGAYPFDTTDPKVDQAIITASLGGSVVDAQQFEVYKATVASIAAAAKRPVVQSGQTTPIDVTVKDQKGNPVVGAEVFDITDGANASLGTTDATGKVTKASAAGTPAGKVHTFYANVNGVAGYQEGFDYKTSTTVTEGALETHAVPSSKLGAAFDIDESASNAAAGNFSLTVTDQNNLPLIGKNVFYRWAYVPFDADDAVGVKNVARDIDNAGSDFVSGPSGIDGKITLTFPTLNTTNTQGGTFTLKGYVNLDGTPGQGSGDLIVTPASYKVGESKIVWSDAPLAQRQAGTIQVFGGSLQLADGTVLGDRAITLSYAQGSAIDDNGNPLPVDAAFAQQADQPAGTTRSSDAMATARTKADGTFSVAVKDPTVATQPAKETGTLAADGVATDNGKVPAVNGVGTDADGSVPVQFLKHPEAARVTISDNGATHEPGQRVQLTVHVENVNANPLSTNVTVSTDHGLLSKTGKAVEANGGLQGAYETDGSSVVVKTNANGDAVLYTVIGRDAGFDDDGLVKAKLKAVSGAVQGADDVNWSTQGDPLNIKSIDLKLSADQTQTANNLPSGFTGGDDGVEGLPEAAANRTVWLDLVVKDQFDNPTGAEVDLASNTTKAGVYGWNSGWTTAEGQFGNDHPAIVAYGEGLTVAQEITATFDGSGATYGDTNPNQDGVQLGGLYPDVTKTDAETINWYEINYAASTYTLTHSGANSQAVNSTVVETYTALDQKGHPIVGLDVEFFRGGPDKLQNGEPANRTFATETDQSGKAFYVFKGVAAGTASITALPYDQNQHPLTAGQVDDSVTFTGTAAKINISPTLKISNWTSGDHAIVDAGTIKAQGAAVRIYKIVNGARVAVADGRIGADGKFRITMKDTNGTSSTKYVARIGGWTKTNGGTTGTVTVR